MKSSIYSVFGLIMLASGALAQSVVTGVTGPRNPVRLPNPTIRLSEDGTGNQANGFSHAPSVSFDGRHASFGSAADNLVPGDVNGVSDVFVRDLVSGTLTLASVDAAGAQGNAESSCTSHSLSSDGRRVLFQSAASNLVPGDTNGFRDVFVRDLDLGTTVRVSVDASGGEAGGNCWPGCIAPDGDVVAFTSLADGLVPADTGGLEDVFVRDLVLGTTERVSVDSAGAGGNGVSQSPSLSADGRLVVFGSWASNLIAGDTNGAGDIFLHDRWTGATTRVSVAESGVEGNASSYAPHITPDGRFVTFASAADNLVAGDFNGESDVFVKDLQSGGLALASLSSGGVQGNGSSWEPSLSADGRYVGFASVADDLTPGDTNLCSDGFVRDLLTGQTWLSTADAYGGLGNDASWAPTVSGDGRFVVFESAAWNLVPGDTNLFQDVFARRNRP